MSRRLDRYLITESLWLFFGFLVLASAILLIERMVRLTEIVSSADNPAFDAVRLMTRLLPHYIELALPCALVLTTIMTMNRLSREGEITAILGSGASLYQVARPFVIASVILASLSLLSSGYLKPLTRYNFRAIIHEISQDSIVNAFQEGKFTQFDDWTVWTEGIDPTDNSLGATFLLDGGGDGSEEFLIGSSGRLTQSPDGFWVITLNDAMVGELPERPASGNASHATVRQIELQMTLAASTFRERGLDVWELTLTELINGTYRDGSHPIDPVVAQTELHDRLVRALMLVSLTVIGVVIGLNVQRRPRPGGLFLGIILLLGVQKLLEFGLLEAQQGSIPIWAGAWPLYLCVTVFAVLLFQFANSARPPRSGIFTRFTRPAV